MSAVNVERPLISNILTASPFGNYKLTPNSLRTLFKMFCFAFGRPPTIRYSSNLSALTAYTTHFRINFTMFFSRLFAATNYELAVGKITILQ